MTHSADPERRRGFPLGWVLLAVIVVALTIRTIDVLLVVFLAVILAIYLDAVSVFLQRRLDVPSPVSLVVALALGLGALVGVVFLIAPAVTSQVQDFIANLPKFLSDLDQSINRLFRSIPVLRRGVTEGAAPGLLATSLNELFGVLRGALVPYLKGGIELLIEGVSVVVMAVYLARHPAIYLDGLVALVPPAQRRLARLILFDLKVTLRAWVVGQIIAMVLLAALTRSPLVDRDALLPGVSGVRRRSGYRALLRNPNFQPSFRHSSPSGSLACLRPWRCGARHRGSPHRGQLRRAGRDGAADKSPPGHHHRGRSADREALWTCRPHRGCSHPGLRDGPDPPYTAGRGVRRPHQ